MKHLTLALLIGALLGLSGCSVWQGVQERVGESEVTSRLVVSQITSRIINEADNPKERASKIQDIVSKVREQLNQDTTARLDEIEAVVREQIDWNDLSAPDQELVNFALVKARESLDELIGDGVLKDDDIETVGTLMDWIDEAASRV